MGGQEVDFGRHKGEPGKAVQAGKRGKELKTVTVRSEIIANKKLIKAGLYRIWCGVNILGFRHSAIVKPAGQLLLTRRINNS